MKSLTFLLLLIITSCISCQKPNDKETYNTINSNPKPKVKTHPWDFNGQGHFEPFQITNAKAQENLTKDSISDTYRLIFENKAIPDLNIGDRTASPLGEGDLNGDGKAELSIFQKPANGCIYTISTYTLQSGKWRLLFKPFLVPTICEKLNIEMLDNLIFFENGKVYILETDMNDKNFKKIKKEAKLL